jgi:tetratricopeptide (TPR) repeat protein
MRSWSRFFFIFSLLMSWVVFAQPTPPKRTPEQEKQWTKLQEDAGKYYDKKQYDKALEAFLAMYNIDPNPLLAFNIGRCQEELGLKKEALRSYQIFLEKVPKTDPSYKKVKETADALEKDLKDVAPPPKPPEPKKPLGERLTTMKPGAYYGVSAGVMVIGGGFGVFSLVNATELRDRVQNDSFDDTETFAKRMRRGAIASDLSFAVAGGLIWYGYKRSFVQPTTPSASLMLSPFGVSLVGGF